MSLFADLNRRNVTRTAIAYAAAAWLILQVAETVLPVFGFGDGAVRAVVIVLAAGFVPALVISWLFELTPSGIKRDSAIDRDAKDRALSRKWIDRFIVATLALAATFFAVDKFVLDPARDADREQAIAEAAHDAGRAAALNEQLGKTTIAVLPLSDAGSDPEQAYLSFGIAEDLVSLLAKVMETRVISTSASFRFVDSELSNREIAEQLNATHLLRGFVRSTSDNIRIGVQLIDARSESVLWAENYGRQPGDLFAIQEDVSRQAVASIAPSLSDRLAEARRPDMAGDYLEFLQARYLYFQAREMRDTTMVRAAMDRYGDLLARSPGYARAHAGLADAWGFLAIIGEVDASEGYARSRAAAQRALDLDSEVTEAWLAVADVQFEYDWNFQVAGESYRRALQLEPHNAEGLRSYAFFLSSLGNSSAALEHYQSSLIVDPLSVRAYIGILVTQLNAEDFDGAQETLAEVESLAPGDWSDIQRHIYIWQSEFERAAALLPEEPQGIFELRDAAMIERGVGDRRKAEELISQVLAIETSLPKYRMAAIYYAMGDDNDKALEYLQKSLEYREFNPAESLGTSAFIELRDDERFWELLESGGVVLPENYRS